VLHYKFIGDVNYNFQLFGDVLVIANTKTENLELPLTKAMIISICGEKIFIAKFWLCSLPLKNSVLIM